MLFHEARAILNRHCQYFDGKEASTNKSYKNGPNVDGCQEAWWRVHSGRTPDWRNPRTVAYLAAYVEMAGTHIPMQGIPLDDGFLWPDRAVMRSLLERGCVIVEDSSFVLTGAGELLLAPVVRVDEDKITVVMLR